MKTKLLTVGMIACLLCGLCACGDNGASDDVNMDKPSGVSEKNDVRDTSSNSSEEHSVQLTAYESRFSNGPIPAQDTNELWGYIDQTGNWVIEPVFGDARSFWSSGLALVKDAESELWGIIDGSGQCGVYPIFSGVGKYVREGLLRVYVPDAGWGYIDTYGSFVIEPQFQAAKDFSEGFAAVSSQIQFTGAGNQYYYQLWGYINTSGERITEDLFSEANDFSEGLACVNQGDPLLDGGYGYIDNSGSFAIKPLYTEATSFYNGLAFVDVWAAGSKYYGLIDKEGNALTGPVCRNLARPYFAEDLCCVWALDRAGYIYIDKTGNTVLPTTEAPYADARNFSNGYAAVASADTHRYGYIDLSGNWVIPPQYMKAEDFSPDGIAIVWIDGINKQIIDTSGNCLFEAAAVGNLRTPERIEVTPVSSDGVTKVGFWSINDGIVIDYMFDQADRFAIDYSYAKVQYDGLWGVIDKDGNWLIPARFLDIGGV